MFKKAQGLPLNTIIIIVLTLFVLAGVGIYFFGQFGTGTESTNSAQCIQLCESLKAQMSSDETLTWDDLKNSETRINFCNGNCPSVVECKVRENDKDPSTSWKGVHLKSSDGTPYCKIG
jgi:hypothetical protein